MIHLNESILNVVFFKVAASIATFYDIGHLFIDASIENKGNTEIVKGQLLLWLIFKTLFLSWKQ